MINLWYEESYWGGRPSGPQRVVQNTIEALTQECIPYCKNADKFKYNFLMQYQHDIAVKKHENLEHSSCIIGPQFWPFDSYGQFLIENQDYYKKIIAPSDWVEDLFINKCGLSSDKVAVWPVGIQVPDLKCDNSIDCLVYHKGRDDKDLQSVSEFLQDRQISYEILKYGSYSPSDFKNILSKVRFCIIIDGTESQGIAIQEMMAYNKPLLVWDVREWTYMGEQYKVDCSSVPYWSDRCGKKFFELSELKNSFEEFYDNLNYYEPKTLIDSDLSYSQSIKKLIKIFEK